MGANEVHVNDIAEFIEAVSRLKRNWFSKEPNWGPWFRGHAQADWKLTPKLYRRGPTRRRLRDIEDEIRQEFIIRAPGLIGLTEEKPQNAWEWYFIMQHSGAPTRLLDWTEGALVALYFAVRDSDGTKDASVWALEPWKLNERFLKEPEVLAPGASAVILDSDAARYGPWLPHIYVREAELPDSPIAVYPSHIGRRVSTQRSCFTVHGSDVEGLDRLVCEGWPFLVNVIVSSSAVQTLVEQLALFGVDELSIFPDIDGLGRLLSTTLKTEPDEN